MNLQLLNASIPQESHKVIIISKNEMPFMDVKEAEIGVNDISVFWLTIWDEIAPSKRYPITKR